MNRASNELCVSIITPTYKRPAALKQVVQCVLNQTHQNWEHIIVADGFDKGVEDLVKRYKCQKIKHLFTPRTADWGNSQRNYALQYASGEFVVFLDDDNLINKDYLEKMVNGFYSEKIGYVICQILLHSRNILKPELPFRLGKIDALNFMIRKQLILEAGGYPLYHDADFGLIDRVSKLSAGHFINEVLGEHRRLKSDYWQVERLIPIIKRKLLLVIKNKK